MRALRRTLLVLVIAVLPNIAAAGSATYTTPGTYTFTVPAYGSLMVQVWGGGGGGGISHSYNLVSGGNGGQSRFGSVLAGGGGGGPFLHASGGAGGTASGGDINISGSPGASWWYQIVGNTDYRYGGVGGSAPYGGAGGSEGSTHGWNPSVMSGKPGAHPGGGGGGAIDGGWYAAPSGGGGSGAYAQKTYTAGQIAVGSAVTVVVGSGGQSTSFMSITSGSGASGRVSVTWTDALPPSCSISVSPTTVNQGASATLSWSATNQSTFYISNVGYVNAPGSASVAPSGATTYTGTVSGPGGTANCSATLTINQSCALPWGGTIASGQSTTAYQASTVPYGSSCVSQTRSCTSGTLSGSYTNQSCSVTPGASCTQGGVTVAHGESDTFYSSQIAPTGQLCSAVAQTRTCTNGSLSGSAAYQYGSCTCAPIYSCSGNDVTYTDGSCSTTTVASCTLPNYCSPGVSSCVTPPPSFNAGAGTTGHLQVRPQLIAVGQSATVLWDVGNVASCSVSGSNGQSWSAKSGSHSTGSLSERTTYTLTCVPLGDHTFTPETAVVNIIPVFQEL